MNNIWDNVWLWIPVNTWFVVQCMKIIIELIKSKKLNLRRIVGSGGMPSSHSAFVCSLATTIGITEGVSSPLIELLGHTPLEVYVGALVGIVMAFLFVPIWR